MCYSYCKGNSNFKYIKKSSHYPTLINIYYYILNKHTANNICYIVRYLISLVDIYLLYICIVYGRIGSLTEKWAQQNT